MSNHDGADAASSRLCRRAWFVTFYRYGTVCPNPPSSPTGQSQL